MSTVSSLVHLIKSSHDKEKSLFHDNRVGIEDYPKVDYLALGCELCGDKDFINTGLSESRIDSNRERFGRNEITIPGGSSYWSFIKEGLGDPTLRILLFSSVISFALGFSSPKGHHGIEGISVLFTVMIVVNVQAITNYNKASEFRVQQQELENRRSISIIRDSNVTKQHPRGLVVGDVILLKVGVVIPADGVLVSGFVKMDESSLTGESTLIKKEVGSIVVSGTNVMEGEGSVLILAVGENSISGRILTSIIREHEEATESVLFHKLDTLALTVGKVGMICSFFVFVSLVFSWVFFCPAGQQECDSNTSFRDKVAILLDFFITAVTVLVVAVPEGLPLAVTLSLSVALSKLLKDRNQVKRFDSCETMGSATTICSDKTGTLTENRMTVVYANFPKDQMEYVKQCLALVVSSDSYVKLGEGNQKPVYHGNPTECALLMYCIKELQMDYTEFQKQFVDPSTPGLRWGSYLNPFSSEKKMMSLVIKTSDGKKHTLLAKGAPSVLLNKSVSTFDENGNVVPLDETRKAQYLQEFTQQEKLARRVLAFGIKLDLKNKKADDENLIFLGWVGIQDALRSNVKESVLACQKAGVVVRMITGDSLPTAIAVAKECGILSENAERDSAMTGAEFEERVHVKDHSLPKVTRRMYDFDRKQDRIAEAPQFLTNHKGHRVVNVDEMDKIWPNLRVLARCEPEDKLTLVKGIRSSKLYLKNPSIPPQVVAVTGDGTNDAPSLKAADVGFAMGIAGTDVAKQAADVILLDDSFNSIVRALIWGRNVHDSVCKFLQFQMTVNLSAVIITTLGSVFLMKSPMSATQMLWVNMIMDSLGSLALATSDPNENQLLSRPPISRHAPVISSRMKVNIVGQAVFQLAYLLHMLYRHDESKTFYTILFNTFVLFQLFNEINCRSVNGSMRERFQLTGGVFTFIVLASFGIQVLIVQYGRLIFNSSPLTFKQWMSCIGFAALSLPWQFLVVDPIASWLETGKKDEGVIVPEEEEERLSEDELITNYGSINNNIKKSEGPKRRKWALLKNSVMFVNAAKAGKERSSRTIAGKPERVVARLVKSLSKQSVNST